jgi:polysaccharide biosynthesis protein PslG
LPAGRPLVAQAGPFTQLVMRRTWTVALVVALVAFATLGAGTAFARSGFIGVQDVSDKLGHRDLVRMDQGGVGIVRRLLYWPAVEPRRGTFAWRGTDRVVGRLASRGIDLLPMVYGSPRYIARHSNVPPVRSKKKRKIFGQFLSALVKRYGHGGTYWTDPHLYRHQHPGKAARPVVAWQIWNEPNLEKFFAPRPSVGKYARLVRTAHSAIHAADPEAKVVLAGMSGRGHPADRKFLNRFYRQRRIKRSFDAVAVNPYAPQVHQTGVKIKRIRGVMRRHGDRDTGLWITEIGWGSHPPDRFGLNKGLKGQRRMLARSFRLIVHHRKAWHINRLIWFDFRDPRGNAGGCSFCTSAGLLRKSGKPKPAWRTFKRFTH